ncbi:MAG: LarC family nickel insertion protein, partial [Anaerolineales bacterium]|nr:LarC family nickel insertion protein [Anaerolineales bacterium]
PIPPMRLESVGYGAGGRDLPIPNLLRVLIGDSEKPNKASLGSRVMLETNIDDLNPEIYNYVMDVLFAAGALDVFFTPVHMKKNRPAILLQVLAQPGDAPRLRDILFEETSTLGVRQSYLERYALNREIRNVTTSYGVVRVKVAHLGNENTKIAPEYEDCRKLAQQHNVPIREIYQAAESAATGLS